MQFQVREQLFLKRHKLLQQLKTLFSCFICCHAKHFNLNTQVIAIFTKYIQLLETSVSSVLNALDILFLLI